MKNEDEKGPEEVEIVIDADADFENADWTKATWDLVGIDSPEKLRAYLDVSGDTVEAFKKRPLYKFNVDKEGMEWLKDL